MIFTPTFWDILRQQSPAGQLDLSALRYQLPLVACLLLFAAAWLLTGDMGRRRRYVVVAGTIALVGVLLYYNGLLTAPGSLLASALNFVPLVVAGAGVGSAFALAKRHRGGLVLLPLMAAGIALAVVVVAISPWTGIIDYPYQGTGFFVVLPLAGGIVLALSLAARQRRHSWYSTLWLLFAGTIGLGVYLNLMEGITYAFAAPARMFGPDANVRVMEATIEALTATCVYVGGSLLLLVLPLTLTRGRRHGKGVAPLEEPEQAGQPRQPGDTYQSGRGHHAPHVQPGDASRASGGVAG